MVRRRSTEDKVVDSVLSLSHPTHHPMKKVRSLLSWFFKSRYAECLSEQSQIQPETPTPLVFNPICVLRGDYELMSGAVAIVRTELPNSRHEKAYYPEQAQDFYNEVVSSLARNHSVTVQTNLDPQSLGLGRDSKGRGVITLKQVLGEA